MAGSLPDPFEADPNKEGFFYPIHGTTDADASFPEVVFNANLQEFSQRVAIICALESNGKLTPLEAYDYIKDLWQRLESSKESLLDYPMPNISDLD
ncbi:MAG: hypothetical protein NW237_08205 [Cyanobacteriota bacterium]|nr:hypothetical protein [Cyanobacteriota bacterium]